MRQTDGSSNHFSSLGWRIRPFPFSNIFYAPCPRWTCEIKSNSFVKHYISWMLQHQLLVFWCLIWRCFHLFGEGVHVSGVVWSLLTCRRLNLRLSLIERVLDTTTKRRIHTSKPSASNVFILCVCVCELVCTCILMLDRMIRRVILLSEAELRSLSKFLFMRYCLNAVWIVLAARRDTNGPPYFLSSISTYQTAASYTQAANQGRKHAVSPLVSHISEAQFSIRIIII